MSVIVSNCQQIHNSPLNRSSAKALFSIPKAKRDDMAKKDINHAFYDLPAVKNSRSAGFGYGQKYDFTQGMDKTPAPNSYEPKGTLDDERKKRGFSFGLSREQMAVTGGMIVGDRTSPGPGAYNVRGLNTKNIAYTFRPKTNADILVTNKSIPGPGAYAMVGTISKDGKYFVSKFKNSGASIIAPVTSKRGGIDTVKDVPGPGAYNPKTSLAEPGTYFNSKFKSSQCRTFGSSVQRSASTSTFGATNDVPGPGTYRLPSEFGYYEAKNAKEFESSIRLKDQNKSVSSIRPSKLNTSITSHKNDAKGQTSERNTSRAENS